MPDLFTELLHRMSGMGARAMGSLPGVREEAKYDEKVDRPFLEQFVHPEKDILSPQTLRPTKLSSVPNIPFRSFGDIDPSRIYNYPEGTDPSLIQTDEQNRIL